MRLICLVALKAALCDLARQIQLKTEETKAAGE